MKKLKRAAAIILSAALTVAMVPNLAMAGGEGLVSVPAFPGAEGGGKYTQGARANDTVQIYHVTNLNDSGEGSLRQGVSTPGNIVVFDVDGTIVLNSTLKIGKNVTVLGQTAPGEGITITGRDVSTADGASDIIFRYMRVRPTDDQNVELDGLGGRYNTNVIFDHCSLSWSVDELMTLYAGSFESVAEGKPHGSYLTVQNTLAAESLRLSSHFKGAHGYGGIMGGDFATYHHNLLAHHDSRSPRLDREMNGTEVTMNLIYDWGQTNSAYGGEPYSMHDKSRNPTNVNYTNNYYMYGPATRSSLRNRLFDATNDHQDEIKSNFYFNGNFMYGDAAVTADNSKGLKDASKVNLLTEPYDMGAYTLPEYETADQAYNTVLDTVGATIPKRDAVDARIVDDVRHKTGRIINNASEVGGMIGLENKPTETRVYVVPKDWITEKGLDAYGEADIIQDGIYAGYTLMEAYVNEWTAEQEKPTNPSIVVMSPAISALEKTIDGNTVDNGNWTVVNEGETITYHAVAKAMGSPVTKMELYDKNELVKAYDGTAEINDSITLPAGTHYLTSRAYDEKGEKTQSTTSIVYVKKTSESLGELQFTEIGGGGSFKGQGGAAYENGTYTIYGSGTLTNGSTSDTNYPVSNKVTADDNAYLYMPVTGNFDIRIKTDSIPRFENQQNNGLMFRETLDPGSRMAMITYSMLKYGENDRILFRETKNSNSMFTYFLTKQGTYAVNSSSGDNVPLAPYMRIVRYNNDIYLMVSEDGVSYTKGTRQPWSKTFDNLPDTVYVGYAVDSADDISTKPNFAETTFSGLTIKTGAEVTDPADEMGGIKLEKVDHNTSNGFSYDRSFLMKDKAEGESVGSWIISSDGDATMCYETDEAVSGNETNKLVLENKAVQIEIPEKYQTGDYKVDFDFLTTNTAADGRSFRVYMDNAVHPYSAENGQATAMGNENAFFHITDLKNTVYATKTAADIAAGKDADTSGFDKIWDVEANKWYHITLEGTNGADSVKITVSAHGSDGSYDPENLSAPLFSGSVSTTEGRDTTFKQLKFMRTAAGTLYFDNIVFAGAAEGGDEPTTEATTDTSSEATTEEEEHSGDVDGKAGVSSNDAAVVLYYVINSGADLNAAWNVDMESADMDNNGTIDAADAALILSKVLNPAK